MLREKSHDQWLEKVERSAEIYLLRAVLSISSLNIMFTEPVSIAYYAVDRIPPQLLFFNDI